MPIKGLRKHLVSIPYCYWASGQVVRALDCCAKHRWFEPNPRIIVGMLAHCPPSSKWGPGGNTGEAKGGEERNWPPHLTMPTAQDKCPSNGHSPNVRNRAWDSPLPFLPYCCITRYFYKEPLYKEPTCRRPKYLKNLYY